MKFNDILSIIRDLSYSQGFYGRLYRSIMDLKENDYEEFLNIVEELENQNFNDSLDVVLYFEC